MGRPRWLLLNYNRYEEWVSKVKIVNEKEGCEIGNVRNGEEGIEVHNALFAYLFVQP